jgi:2-hydroxy-3-oxopropionate reductase
MTVVGFVGLGVMGAPMSRNLLSAGFDVIGFNRSRPAVDELVLDGGRAAASVAEAAKDVDVFVTMVPDSPDVDAVMATVFQVVSPGTLVIDFSSIRPDVSAKLGAEGRAKGLRVLDAPVSGGEQGAIDGTLSIMVGGDVIDFEAARPILEAVGKTIVHVGAHGSGQTVKAANQLIVAGHIALLAEAIVFLDAHGVELDAALRVLGGGLAGSTVLARKGASMIAHYFRPGFRVALHSKDMGIVTSSARAAGVIIPLGAMVAQLISALESQGYGDLDHSALIKIVEQLSGVSPSA